MGKLRGVGAQIQGVVTAQLACILMNLWKIQLLSHTVARVCAEGRSQLNMGI